MTPDEKTGFGKAMYALFLPYGKPPAADLVQVWWDVCAEVSLAEFKAAAAQHVAECRFVPTPADILDRCPSRNLGHPDPETAWNLLPKSETDTAYVTAQMMAGLAACQDSLDRGDLIGARMAFLEVYRRELQDARRRREGAKPWLSKGCGLTYEQSETASQHALEQAAAVGLMPMPTTSPMLPGSRTTTGLETAASLLPFIGPGKAASTT
jgi:hypothetical protein